MVMKNTYNNLVSVLLSTGVEEEVAVYFGWNRLLLHISSDLLRHFTGLYSHILYVSETRGWDNALVNKDYHSNNTKEDPHNPWGVAEVELLLLFSDQMYQNINIHWLSQKACNHLSYHHHNNLYLEELLHLEMRSPYIFCKPLIHRL